MVPMVTSNGEMGILFRLVITNVHYQIISASVVTLHRSVCFFCRGLQILRMDIRKGARVKCWHASFVTEWLLTTCEWNYLPHQLIQYKLISIYRTFAAKKWMTNLKLQLFCISNRLEVNISTNDIPLLSYMK